MTDKYKTWSNWSFFNCDFPVFQKIGKIPSAGGNWLTVVKNMYTFKFQRFFSIFKLFVSSWDFWICIQNYSIFCISKVITFKKMIFSGFQLSHLVVSQQRCHLYEGKRDSTWLLRLLEYLGQIRLKFSFLNSCNAKKANFFENTTNTTLSLVTKELLSF